MTSVAADRMAGRRSSLVGGRLNEAWAVLSGVKEDDSFWTLLDEAVGAGPADGGCLICARAVQAVFGGRIVHLERNGRPDHFGVRLAGGILDFDGPARSSRAWIDRFVRLEGIAGHVTFREDFTPSPDFPDDQDAAERLARLIRARRRAAAA